MAGKDRGIVGGEARRRGEKHPSPNEARESIKIRVYYRGSFV